MPILQRLVKWYRIWRNKRRILYRFGKTYPIAYCEQCGRVSLYYSLCLKCAKKNTKVKP